MAKKVKWGILGPGKIATQFAEDFKLTENAILHAVASRSEERAISFAKKFHIPKVYSDYNDLIDDNEVDIIYIATPHNFHFEQTKEAIIKGKSILCEKPLTVTLEETKLIVELSQKHQTYLMEGLWSFFLPSIQKALSWVEEGRIGKVLHLRSNFGFKVPFDASSRLFNPDLAGGTLLDIGIYNVAMAWLFTKRKPKRVNSKLSLAPTGVDQNVISFLDYGDIDIVLHSSFLSKLPNYCTIIGEEGYIEIPNFWMSKSCYLYHDGEIVERFHDDKMGTGFNHEITAVSNDILNNRKESLIHPLSQSVILQELMDEIRISWKSSNEVEKG